MSCEHSFPPSAGPQGISEPRTQLWPLRGEKLDLRKHRNEMAPYTIGAPGQGQSLVPGGEKNKNLNKGIV